MTKISSSEVVRLEIRTLDISNWQLANIGVKKVGFDRFEWMISFHI